MKIPEINKRLNDIVSSPDLAKKSEGEYPYNLKEENKQAKAMY